jgi:tetratricopeptide (TPR) repeat protein
VLFRIYFSVMKKPVRLGLVGGLVVFCVGAVPRLAQGQDALEMAKRRYFAGEADFASGRYWQAAKAFEEAYDLSKKGDLLFNAARAYDKGEYSVRAVETYEAYLRAMPEAADRPAVEKRLAELRRALSQVFIKTSETAFIFVDGHEYGQTPMKQPMPMDSGYHRLELRAGSRIWAREQQFSSGQSYSFDAALEEDRTHSTQGLVTLSERRPKPRTKRFAVVLGAGGLIKVTDSNFPPHQGALSIGAEYRVTEGTYGGLDVALRIPLDVGNSWTNAGLLLGLRGAATPLPKVPLELYASLDMGFVAHEYRSSALITTKYACDTTSQLPSCIVYGLRVSPAIGVAYRFVPAFEARVQLIGLDINFTNPIADPRLHFGVQLAYRF